MAIGAYLVKIQAGREGTPGAPILHFTGVVNAASGVINGGAEITQAVAPPNDVIEIPHVTGMIRHLGLGEDKMVVSLSGQYIVSVPPPAIGAYLAKFDAVLVVDRAWNGTGSFTYNQHTVHDVPVKVLKD